MSEGPLKETEKHFLACVLELASYTGWKVHHIFETRSYARRTDRGFPDLVLVKCPKLLFIELKSAKGKLTNAQADWLLELGRCCIDIPNIEVFCWKPSDWDEIVAVLQGG